MTRFHTTHTPNQLQEADNVIKDTFYWQPKDIQHSGQLVPTYTRPDQPGACWYCRGGLKHGICKNIMWECILGRFFCHLDL